jgi:hypothetical protein
MANKRDSENTKIINLFKSIIIKARSLSIIQNSNGPPLSKSKLQQTGLPTLSNVNITSSEHMGFAIILKYFNNRS